MESKLLGHNATKSLSRIKPVHGDQCHLLHYLREKTELGMKAKEEKSKWH
jgi:hypothetical protein